MTFKHSKFDDSPIMRSFEKTAINKGLIKKEEIVKSASKEVDLKASGYLDQDIIKVCNFLRSSGQIKNAEEIENKFIKYKKAQYDVSKETGEDVIDQAHPKGSHDLVGVLGDAKVETILDTHLALVKMVDKKPTGKLSYNNSNDIIKAARVILAQESDYKALLKQAYGFMYKAASIVKETLEHGGSTIFSVRGRNEFINSKIMNSVKDNYEIIHSSTFGMEQLSDFIENINRFKSAAQPSFLGGVDNEAALAVINENLEKALNFAKTAKANYTKSILGEHSISPEKKVEAPIETELSIKIKSAKSKIAGMKIILDTNSQIPPQYKEKISNWLAKQEEALATMEKTHLPSIQSMSDKEEAKAAEDSLLTSLSSIIANIDKIKSSWTNQ